MLNLDETVITLLSYTAQRDFYLKIFSYSFGSIVLVEVLRSQVPEINLLQLMPGFYIVLLFIGVSYLSIGTELYLRIPFELDLRKEFGTKTENRVITTKDLKITLSLFIPITITSLKTIIPLSLDSFNAYGEETLENIWSFDEVVNLENSLLTLVSIIPFLPLLFVEYFTNEKQNKKLPEFWRPLTLGAVIVAGVATPTIDGSTQLNIAFFVIFLYLIVLNLLVKRVTIKFVGITSFA